MGSIRLQNVCKQFGGQIVLHELSLELHTGQIAALIGPNGVGKTTLFRLIAGQFAPDTGTVTVSKGLEVGYLPQEPDITAHATLHDAVSEAFTDLMAMEGKIEALAHQIAECHDAPHVHELMEQYDKARARFETAGGYTFEQRLNEVLGGLGFSPADYQLPVAALSGGQKCRAALAKLLLQERQFLLLDEPTNHLDIDAVRWLEKFLAGHHGGAVIVSHDRYLLDRLAERMIAFVPGGRVESVLGNYSNFVATRATRRLTQGRQYEQDRAFIAKEQDYIARHMAGQRSRQAKGRLKRLERQINDGEFVLEKPTDEHTLRLNFTPSTGGGPSKSPSRKTPDSAGARSDKDIVRSAGLCKQYGDKLLFRDLDLEVRGGQRLGITGPNGTGKTTLLKIILDQVTPDAGYAKLAPNVRVGYFAQESTELDPERSVISEITDSRPDFLERDARHYAARFLFTGDDPFKRIGALSGGEQSRFRFMKLILSAPDVLILDEPTNHLDIPSREALEAALADFPGAVIAVSHDRYFLDRIAEKLLVIRLDQHQLYSGNYSYYIAQIEQQRAAEEAAAQTARKAARPARGTRPAQRRSSSSPGASVSRFTKLKLEELEAFIAGHETHVAKLQERFGDPAVYRDPAEIAQLRADYDTLAGELAEAEQAWLDRVDRM